ncbi:hypothetical protein OsI_29743 [Oryza sativa Indica Group]|uniref:Transmembrane 9 superfamily member n=1 Tax=Oryza sativa subsp. indica TaxID=39946 RepID=A2YWM3_ORYSI|nr:hypothetical protein OsI_29743 [Oryza sativa Indica Group]
MVSCCGWRPAEVVWSPAEEAAADAEEMVAAAVELTGAPADGVSGCEDVDAESFSMKEINAFRAAVEEIAAADSATLAAVVGSMPCRASGWKAARTAADAASTAVTGVMDGGGGSSAIVRRRGEEGEDGAAAWGARRRAGEEMRRGVGDAAAREQKRRGGGAGGTRRARRLAHTCSRLLEDLCFRWLGLCIFLVLRLHYCNAFYLPGSYMHTYSQGEEIWAKVNSLTSIETEMPFSYYSLPYCRPQGGIKKSAENLGELLMGDQIDNSPYRFRVNVNESLYLCTTKGLNENDAKLLKQRTRDLYQILGMAIVTIIFSTLGFMSPASRGMLLTGMIILYLFLGIAAGYVSVRLWKTIKGTSEGWRSVSWLTACFFPGVLFMVLTVLNFVLWGSKSTGALPISLFFALLAMWFCISVPLTLVGGFVGTRSAQIEFPVRTNQIPREIPARKYPSWLLVLGAGTLPFGTLFIELFFILSSIWLGRFYYVFGFLLIVLVLLVIVCAEVSVVLTYMNLCVEDWRWWWKAFFASGSVAIYVFLYSINYLVFDLRSLSGPVSAMLYLGYSFLMAFAIMLATGTIGFLTSFSFVHYLFSSVKID